MICILTINDIFALVKKKENLCDDLKSFCSLKKKSIFELHSAFFFICFQMSVQNYLRAVSDAWNDYDGDTLANYLSFQDRHAANPKLHIENPEEDVDRELEPPIDELVAAHLRACWAVSKKDFVEAYKCQALSVQNFCKLLSSEKDSNWPLPMMYALCLDLRLFALKADDQLSHKGGKPGKNTVTVL